jgi:glucose dehydrogenase
MNIYDSAKPPRIFPVILFLIAIPLVLGGLQLVFLGGSFYYLLAGLVLVASAYRLWHADPTGSLVYGGLLIAVDALTGERCIQFGELGEVNLAENMGNDPQIFNFQTSPPGIVRGNAVVGGCY